MLCHIAIAAEWDAAQASGLYDRSTLQASIADVGFMHASDSYEQASRVLRYLFGEVREPLVLLDLDRAMIATSGLEIRHECASPKDPASEKFPHIYGGPLPVGCVRRVQRFQTTREILSVLDAGEAPLPGSAA